MVAKDVIVITLLWGFSHMCYAQSWVPTSWFGRLQTPLAEPVPEPEPAVRRISIPGFRIYRIPVAEPEQQQIKRVSRRIIGTQKLPVSGTDNNSIEKYSTILTLATATSSSSALSSSTASSSSTEIPMNIETNTSEETFFAEIFSDVSEQRSWSIDTARFHIIPAVPSKTTSEVLRVPKEVSEEEKVGSVEKETIPAVFSPVPAVPVTTAASSIPAAPAPDSTSEVSPDNPSEVSPDSTSEVSPDSTSEVSPVSCQGNCVHQFCDDSDKLCKEKCSALCTL